MISSLQNKVLAVIVPVLLPDSYTDLMEFDISIDFPQLNDRIFIKQGVGCGSIGIAV